MAQQIQGSKFVTLFVARNQRPKVLAIERELERLARVVDDFYDRLGARNWIFHDQLSLDKIETILAETSDPGTAETRLIELYRDNETIKWWIMRLRAQDGLRERFHQIERAKEHYDANQFNSCVLQLIAVMDGFVNDFEPDVRKGLASRDPDDMTAWDSVVGHHMGLTHAMSTFRKTIKKRVDEEVFEVYRHGIVHGSVVHFDNIIVATKAWNMLFSVTDWAKATHKAAAPRRPEPSWSDLWSTIKRQAAYKAYEKGFVPRTITPSDAEFANNEVVQRATDFLDAWQHRRWGLVAAFTPPMLLGSTPEGQAARFAKDVFEEHDLSTWKITTVTYDQASSVEIRAIATLNDDMTELRFRMVLWTADGNVGMPGDDGASWRLAVWAPNTFTEVG